MTTIDPSLLNSIFSVTYKYAPDPGDTVSYTKALINIKNVHSLTVDTLTYSNIDFGDASGNLFVGDRAGCNSSLVSNCTAIGEQSMDYLAKGSNATSVGFSALRNTASLTRVVAIGTYAGDSNSNVADTIIIGDLTARNLSGASSNVIIGSGAATSLTGGSNNILIGAGVNPFVGSTNNVINIGNTISGTIGGTISMPSVYANGVSVPDGGGNPGFFVQDVSANTQLRLQWLSGGNARSVIQSTAPLTFTKIGSAQCNTYLNLSTAFTDGDLLHVGGDLEARTLKGYSTTSASTTMTLTTSYGSTSQQIAYTLVDTNSLGYGFERQLATYIYPATGKTARPLGGGGELKASVLLLSDQSITGLSAGDVVFYNTVSAASLTTPNFYSSVVERSVYITATGTLSVPTGYTKIHVTAVGGGGGGASVDQNDAGAGGGGGAGYLAEQLFSVSDTTLSFTVGTGGSGGSTGTVGSNGTSTYLQYNGFTLMVSGGSGGNIPTGGSLQNGGVGGTGYWGGGGGGGGIVGSGTGGSGGTGVIQSGGVGGNATATVGGNGGAGGGSSNGGVGGGFPGGGGGGGPGGGIGATSPTMLGGNGTYGCGGGGAILGEGGNGGSGYIVLKFLP